jgi:hypothetical protein
MNNVAEISVDSSVSQREAPECDFSPRRDIGELGRRPQLRADLVMRAEPGGNGGGSILAPVEGAADLSYVFGPHEFRLASCLNGERSLEQIRETMIEMDPSLSHLRVDQVARLVDWLEKMGLLEAENVAVPIAHPLLPLVQATAPIGSKEPAMPPAEERPLAPATSKSGRPGLGRKFTLMVGKAACLAVVIWCAQTGATWLRAERSNRDASEVVSADGSVALAAEFDGVLREVWVRDGDKVYPGDLLARIDNLEIQRELERLRNDLIECQQRRNDHYEDGDTYEYRKEVEKLATITRTIGQLRFDREQVELRSPIAGVIRAGIDLREQIGSRILTGQRLLMVQPSADMADRGMLVTATAAARADSSAR